MSLAASAVEARPFFLTVGSHACFCMLWQPAQRPPSAGMVFVPPFAEEANRSRRTVALCARALAEKGWAVLVLDLHGCGDSSGELADADWSSWCDDVRAAEDWLRSHCGSAPWLWGLRSGCLLLAEHVQAGPAPARVIFWQPVLSGDAYLGQFLRLKVAAQALATAAEPGVRADTRALRDRLAAGETLEVAGYALTAALTDGLARARLELDPARIERLVWLEVGRTESGLMPASRKWLEGMPAERTVAEVVEGPACWQTQETTENHALIAATLSRLAEAGS
jgi:exosortase A-associated hydrolase 2